MEMYWPVKYHKPVRRMELRIGLLATRIFHYYEMIGDFWILG
jgi:hypothetical protein